MWLQIKMWLLVGIMFAILYGIAVGVGNFLGIGNFYSYFFVALFFTFLQYWIGPEMVSIFMRIKWVSESEEPELHKMVEELAQKAKIPKPKVGISQIPIPNAFAFGRSLKDGRVCVTQGILKILTKEELKGVLGHEISHLKHRDMIVITMLSVIPLVCYWLAWRLLWFGDRERKDYSFLIGFGAMLAYFLTNLLVLAASRIREYYADERSVKLGNPPHSLASALYKLVYAVASLRRNPQILNQMRRVEGLKAFFLNDISRAHKEISDLKALDKDFSGSIDEKELEEVRSKQIKISPIERLMEIFSTHPNILKRIKRLSSLA